jgi:cell division septation protein DedD
MKSQNLRLIGGTLFALLATPGHADMRTGEVAWQRGDYPTAVSEWRPLAIAGDPDAQLHMGQAYQLGRGVPVDLKMAEDWFRRSASQGNLDGKDSYGLILFQNGKRAEGLPYVEDAAGRGNPRAQYILGTALFNGDMIAKDWPRGYAMMLRASAAGIPAAKASLAEMDKFIPIDQRARGKALAGAFEAHANSETAAAEQTGNRTSILPSPAPAIGASPVIERKAAMAKPVKVAIFVPVPKPDKPMTTAPSGKWRIQLGAFADGSKAGSLWSGLHGRIPVLAPYQSYVVKAGPMTRLQAGPLPSRSAADRLCAAIRSSKQPCLTVAP